MGIKTAHNIILPTSLMSLLQKPCEGSEADKVRLILAYSELMWLACFD